MIGIVPPWLNPSPHPLPGPESSPVPSVAFLAGGGPQWAAGCRPVGSTLVNASGALSGDGWEGARCVASSWAGGSIHSVARVLPHPTNAGGLHG